MSITASSYPAKILLFGEYTIIKGGQALAMPLPSYHGQWAFATKEQELRKLQQRLPALCKHLQALKKANTLLGALDLDQFQKDISVGLYFNSTIPGGYGAGSSGALCAAIYDRYCSEKTNKELPKLKQALAQIESFFHGSSSGIDPLVSYLNTGVHIISKEQLTSIALPDPDPKIPVCFLLDTGQSRQTEPLVQLFLQKWEQVNFKQQGFFPLLQLNDLAIQYFLMGNWSAFTECFKKISHLQLEHFPEMIPEPYQEIWRAGWEEEKFHLKLCGAGGGGFFLGITGDWEAVRAKYGDRVRRLKITRNKNF